MFLILRVENVADGNIGSLRKHVTVRWKTFIIWINASLSFNKYYFNSLITETELGEYKQITK